jgi:hypothetical protein
MNGGLRYKNEPVGKDARFALEKEFQLQMH